jgi:hypothetical protein
VAKLSDEEQSALDKLMAKASAPDEPDDVIEIFSGDKGARIPWSKGADWLQREFGIGPAPDGQDGDGDGAADDSGQQPRTGKKPAVKVTPGGQQQQQPRRGSYFARQ